MRPGYTAAILATALTLTTGTPTAWGQSLSPAPVTVSDFAPVTLDGTANTATATMSNFSVSGSHSGWHLTVQATQFQEFDPGSGQYVADGKTLPIGSLTMPAPTVSPASDAVTVTPGPYPIDGASVTIASAATGTTGTYDFTQSGPLTLALPASVYARTYRCEITLAVASGP